MIASIRTVIPLISLLVLGCKYSSTTERHTPQWITDKSAQTAQEDSIPLVKEFPIDYSDSLNYVDEQGWKQGPHIAKNEWGKVILEATYKNDTIVGYYRYWDGMQKDGYYENGKKHGNFNWYYNNGSILLISHWEHDSIIWHAPYIANQFQGYPVKDLTMEVDSVYVEVPHPNGKIWYRGLFVNNKEVGIHETWYDFGVQHGILDYNTRKFTEFDSTGNIIRQDSLRN